MSSHPPWPGASPRKLGEGEGEGGTGEGTGKTLGKSRESLRVTPGEEEAGVRGREGKGHTVGGLGREKLSEMGGKKT